MSPGTHVEERACVAPLVTNDPTFFVIHANTLRVFINGLRAKGDEFALREAQHLELLLDTLAGEKHYQMDHGAREYAFERKEFKQFDNSREARMLVQAEELRLVAEELMNKKIKAALDPATLQDLSSQQVQEILEDLPPCQTKLRVGHWIELREALSGT